MNMFSLVVQLSEFVKYYKKIDLKYTFEHFVQRETLFFFFFKCLFCSNLLVYF